MKQLFSLQYEGEKENMKSDAKQKKDRLALGDVFPKYRIYMLGNGRTKRARVEGAKKLLLCLEKEVKISLGAEMLRVEGEGLSCMNYASGAVEISGEMRSLFFEAKPGVE